MLSITSAMRDTPEFSEILEKISAGGHPIVISGLLSVHKYHIAATLRRLTGRPVLCVFADDYDAQRAIPDLEALSGESSVSLAARDFTFYSVERASHDWERLRLSALHTMACGRSGLIVTSIAALTQRTLPPEALLSNTVSLKIGGEHDFKELCLQLVYLGYKRTEAVETQGQFAVRGGILDFFSPGAAHPIRAEFFGDEIDSMGEFDPETQRRIANVQCATLLPALEALPPRGFDVSAALGGLLTDDVSPELRKNIAADIESLRDGSSLPWFDRYLQLFYPEFTCGLDFLPKDAIILLDDYYKIRETALRAADQHADDIKTLIASGVLSPDFCDFFMSFDAAEARFRSFSLAFLEAFTRSSYNVPLGAIISVIAKQLPSYGGNLEVACADIAHYVSEGFRMIVLAGTRERAHTMREALLRHGVTAALDFGLETLPAPGHVSIGGGSLSAGFEYPNMKLALIAEGQLIAPSRRGKRASRKGRQKIASYMDLSVGCLVVHDLHGIGRFAGVTKITVDRVEKDYIKIIYAGTDALYVPVTQLDMVSKYIGAGEDTHIRLSRLGGADWQKVKSRASGAAKDLAEYLVALYAKRRQTDGFAFPADCEWQRAFEDSFEFEETDDQLRCISEIKTDMERNFPMDRLLCGDVGFGKTEVALRAVMKCVLGGKQAAILVPTTVLAQQHFITAKRRFAKYPVRISVLSRFFSPTQNRETLRELRSGALDLVIGTHKLLQKSVVFKNLGLLIVDEEQRFGVSHKERLKEISANIDVLTLTATPIPRTLNMALSGIRDMSVIEEAPTGRHPVQTYVLEHDWNVIADAIRREVVRGGQVYYLHNRVASMDATVSRIMRLVPGITIGIAHGQMDENELSDVMQRMIAGELQVLVCSTIIETGIDISNVNTLIIEDADNLGLAQLHQIRGRVGRSPRHAFAYLTYRRGKVLTEIAEKRLSAIREFAEFGAGFKIAMRDLEIRGAGNVLGAQQSGHMMSVGYDMYLKLLEDAVAEQQGRPTTREVSCSADFTVSANIPDTYVASPEQRMDLYRDIATISDKDDLDDLVDEMIDRFGEPPRETLTLMDIALLRHDAARAGISDLAQKGDLLRITMVAPEFAYIASLCARPLYKGRILLNAGQEPYLTLKLAKDSDVIAIARKFILDYSEVSSVNS